jgi:hypothetical protein
MSYMLDNWLSISAARPARTDRATTTVQRKTQKSESTTFLMVCYDSCLVWKRLYVWGFGLIRDTDDLPVIRENIRKGFLETQSKVNTWVQNFKKKLDGDEEEQEEPEVNYGQPQRETQTYGRVRRSGDSARRSGDRERYDADPQVLGDDFSALELRDSEG